MSNPLDDIENALGAIRCKFSVTVYDIDPEHEDGALAVEVHGNADEIIHAIISAMGNEDVEQLLGTAVTTFILRKGLR